MTAPYADLIGRLRDPNFRGPMQHLRNWTQLDYMHDDAAKAIEALQADNERLREAAVFALTTIYSDGLLRAAGLVDRMAEHDLAEGLRMLAHNEDVACTKLRQAQEPKMTDMVLVPREPTREMIKAGRDAAQSAVAHYVPWNEVAASVWTAMLSAAPPPEGEG